MTEIDERQPLQGSCFCGAAAYILTSKPVLSAYCHCTNCQRLTACPILHTIHFPASSFSWSNTTEESLDRFTMPSKPHKTRYRCKTCGACVASYNNITDHWSVWGAQLRRDAEGRIDRWEIVKPTAHIFYGTRMLDVGDELGKWMGYEGKSEKFVG